MPSPQTSSTQPDLDPDDPCYRVKTHPREGSEKFHVVGTRRGLPAWANLPSLTKSTTSMRVRVNDQVVAYWLDDRDKTQEALALVLSIRVLNPKGIKAVEGNKDMTLLLVAWFLDPPLAPPRNSHPAYPTLSSHLDIISIQAVKSVVSSDNRIPIKEVHIIHCAKKVPAAD
ncbi:uncharacterized protein Z520_07030, partial [Fonsecaea multimorphosa CBS 102226]